MNISFSAMVAREWRLVFRDPWLFSLISWIPLLISLLIWAIFSSGIARALPIGVVDLDHSRMSRALIRLYDASPALAANNHFNSTTKGAHALRAGEIYGLIVIPKGWKKKVFLADLHRSVHLSTASSCLSVKTSIRHFLQPTPHSVPRSKS